MVTRHEEQEPKVPRGQPARERQLLRPGREARVEAAGRDDVPRPLVPCRARPDPGRLCPECLCPGRLCSERLRPGRLRLRTQQEAPCAKSDEPNTERIGTSAPPARPDKATEGRRHPLSVKVVRTGHSFRGRADAPLPDGGARALIGMDMFKWPV